MRWAGLKVACKAPTALNRLFGGGGRPPAFLHNTSGYHEHLRPCSGQHGSTTGSLCKALDVSYQDIITINSTIQDTACKVPSRPDTVSESKRQSFAMVPSLQLMVLSQQLSTCRTCSAAGQSELALKDSTQVQAVSYADQEP